MPVSKEHVERWSSCQLCSLSEYRTNVVFPREFIGKEDSFRVFFLGEAPGYEEDQAGLPFVGRSGQVLNSLITLVNSKLDNEISYRIGNTVSCRPLLNRPPEPYEIKYCLPKVFMEIAEFGPDLVVALGKTAENWSAKNLMLLDALTQQEGFGRKTWRNGIPWLALYHPAYLLRRGTSFLAQMLMKYSSEIADTLKKIGEEQNAKT